MPGVEMTITFDDAPFSDAFARMAEFPGERAQRMWDAIGTAMVGSTQLRFYQTQASAEGEAWKPSQRFLKHGAPPTLIEHGYLVRSQTHNVLDDGVEWGSPLVYAPIHQAGGDIHREAHEQKLYRKTGRDGLSPRFVKRKQANFEQSAHVAAYDIHMPARPYLGISGDDEVTIEDIASRHMQAALLDVSPGDIP